MKQIIRRGRPTGFKMTEESKRQVSVSKTGQTQSEKTKQRISDGVRRLHQTGAPIDVLMVTDFSKSRKYKDKSGYVNISIPNPVIGQPSYQQRYHVAIMEKELGRKLLAGEEIHHWGEKDYNNIKALTLCRNRAEHNVLDKAKKILNQRK